MKLLIRLAGVCLGFSILGALGVLAIVVIISFDLPQINSLSDYNPPIPSQIYSKDGELLLEIGKETREIAQYSEIPPLIVNSFLAAEDDNFFHHSGIDYIGIARAMLKNIKAGRVVQGASTITQQVAKSLLLTSERTYTRKIKDLILAHQIEKKFSKEEILFLYLNQVYLGGGYYGIKAAFKGYFDKELSEATIAEVALIAGLLVAPGKYSPYINPKYAKKRQSYVLNRLLATQKISQEEYNLAVIEKIKIVKRTFSEVKAGYFTDWIRQRLISHFGKEDFISNGYKVTTTINWELQKKAEEEVWEGVKNIDKRQGYKGVLKKLETIDARNAFREEQKENIFQEASTYFYFLPDGTVEKEFSEQLAESENQEDFITERKENPFEKSIVLGNGPISKIIPLLKEKEELVQAQVELVNDSQRLIYADYAGVKLIIPYDNYKWAHERNISTERSYWSYVQNPSSIVEVGDVIEVTFNKKNIRTAWDEVQSNYKKRNLPEKLENLLKTEKFILAQLDQTPDAQAALVSVSPKTGELVSMVGGSDFQRSQFNRAIQSMRQPGSAFKPIIYAVGLENGYNPASILYDTPQALGSMDNQLSWKPRNYDGKFKGTMTFRRALEISRNIPTILLTQKVGVDKIINYVKRAGLNLDLPEDLSVALGSFGINLLDLVKLYTVFPNGGKKLKIKTIEQIVDRSGKQYFLEDEIKSENEIEEKTETQAIVTDAMATSDDIELTEEEAEEPENPFLVNLTDTQVYDSRLSYLMTNLLKGVIQNGTGKRASSISSFIGGKTGTTNNYVDAWFLGFSSELVTGVWAGFDNNDTLGWGETGSKSALPIWSGYMAHGIKMMGESDFIAPSGIVNVNINKETGELSSSSNTFTEAFVEGTEPGSVSKEDDTQAEDSSSYLNNDDYFSEQ